MPVRPWRQKRDRPRRALADSGCVGLRRDRYGVDPLDDATVTAPRWYSSPEPEEDYLFPESEPTVKVKVQCRCGVRGFSNISDLRMCVHFVRQLLLGGRPRPDDLAGRAWCSACKRAVKVFARDLHLA